MKHNHYTKPISFRCKMKCWALRMNLGIMLLTAIQSNAAITSVTATPGTIQCFGGNTCITVLATSNGASTIFYSNGSVTNTTGIFCGYSAGGPYEFSASDIDGSVGSNPVILTQPSKVEVDQIVSTPSGCSGNTGTATVTAIGGSGSYTYSWIPGGQNSNPAVGLAPGNYCVTISDGNCTAAACVTVGTAMPPAPGTISGPKNGCKNQSSIVYSIASVPGATSYQWTLPIGATGASTSNSITVNFTNTFNGGTICVQAKNGSCLSPSTCLNITLLTVKPVKPSTIIGNPKVCGGTLVNYSCAADPNATSYTWYITGGGVNPLSFFSGTNTNAVVINVPNNYPGDQKLHVKAINCIGQSSDQSLDIKLLGYYLTNVTPAITGKTSVCKLKPPTQTYNADSYVPAGTIYTWSVTGGPTIVPPGNTKTATVNFTTATINSADLTVVASNACGTSNANTISIAVNLGCRTIDESEIVASDLNVYPNPASGKLNVSFNGTADEKIIFTIRDMIGKVQFSQSSTAQEGNNLHEINLNGIAKGMYIFHIEKEGIELKAMKIVVE